LKIDCRVASSTTAILEARKIILPGIGHFGTAMSNLARLDLIDVLDEAVLEKKTPVLGICLGMELMAKASEEGQARGLGWLDAQAVRFEGRQDDRHKVPHMGWNQLSIKKRSLLMEGIDESAEFYFAHSYHLRVDDHQDKLSETDYGMTFVSSVEKDNIFGVQYHPEKSHDSGARVLKNFIEM
jgi:glutamine amidotransferase